MSETRGGYTVTLERAYADANSIVVFYSITRDGDVKAELMHTQDALRLADGSVLPQVYQGSAPAVLSSPAGATGDRRDMYLWAFDTARIADLPDTLSLDLTLNYMKTDVHEKAQKTANAVSTSFEEWDARIRALATEVQFSFEVPVTKAGTRVLELNQSKEVDGETLTLERVVITPVEFRAVVRYKRAKEDEDKFLRRANMWLSTGNPAFDGRQQVPPMGYGHLVDRTETTIVHVVVWPLQDQFGEWTLNVYGLELARIEPAPTPGDYPPVKAVQGQWEFKFTVPPVATTGDDANRPDLRPKWDDTSTEYLVGLTEPLNISRKVGPYTVTLESGYADANIILLVYSVESMGDGRGVRDITENRLVRQGASLAVPVGQSRRVFYDRSAEEVSSASGAVEWGRYTYIVRYDAAALGVTSGTVDLTFAPVVYLSHPRTSLPPGTDTSGMTPLSAPGDAGRFDERYGTHALSIFDISLPVAESNERTMELNQRVTNSNVTAVLERVVISESGAYFYVKYEAPHLAGYDLRGTARLVTGDAELDVRGTNLRQDISVSGDPRQTFLVLGPFHRHSGEWTLTMYQLIANPPGQGPQEPVREPQNIIGDWTFKFTVPTAER
jgi:hypothetical protein